MAQKYRTYTIVGDTAYAKGNLGNHYPANSTIEKLLKIGVKSICYRDCELFLM